MIGHRPAANGPDERGLAWKTQNGEQQTLRFLVPKINNLPFHFRRVGEELTIEKHNLGLVGDVPISRYVDMLF